MTFNMIKKAFFAFAAFGILSSAMFSPMNSGAVSLDTPFPVAFQQNEESGAEIQREAYLPEFGNWCDYPWNRGSETGNTVGKAACSLFSVINNVYYHTGKIIEPTGLAQYALDKGYRRAGVEGVAIDFFYGFINDFGAEYGMSFASGTTSSSRVLEHVRNGGAASSNIYGHWISIADYDAENDLYLILDSAQACNRCKNITWTDRENGIAWLTYEQLAADAKNGYYGVNKMYSALYNFDYTFDGEYGDANGDGKIGVDDAVSVLTRYSYLSASMEPLPYHAHPFRNGLCEKLGDFDGDGVVSISDAISILEIYSKRAADITD